MIFLVIWKIKLSNLRLKSKMEFLIKKKTCIRCWPNKNVHLIKYILWLWLPILQYISDDFCFKILLGKLRTTGGIFLEGSKFQRIMSLNYYKIPYMVASSWDGQNRLPTWMINSPYDLYWKLYIHFLYPLSTICLLS